MYIYVCKIQLIWWKTDMYSQSRRSLLVDLHLIKEIMPVSSPATERSRRTTDTGIASREMLCRFDSVFQLRKWHIDGTWPLVGSLTISLGWLVTAWLDLHYHTEHTEVAYNPQQHTYTQTSLTLSFHLSSMLPYSKHLPAIFDDIEQVVKMFQCSSPMGFVDFSQYIYPSSFSIVIVFLSQFPKSGFPITGFFTCMIKIILKKVCDVAKFASHKNTPIYECGWGNPDIMLRLFSSVHFRNG